MLIPVVYQRRDRHDPISGSRLDCGHLAIHRRFPFGRVALSVQPGSKVQEIQLSAEDAETLAQELLAQVKVLREGYEEEVPVYAPVPYDPKVHHGMLTGLDIGGVFHVEVKTGTTKRWVQPAKTFANAER